MIAYRPDEHSVPLRTELMGAVTEYMLAPDGSSGARVQMQGGHMGQAPCIVGNEKRHLFTGVEFEYAKYTFNVKVPETCKVEAVISRYPAGGIGIARPLETVAFVRHIDNPRHIDVIHIPMFQSNHQYFGYDMVLSETGRNIKKGMILKKGTILADTPGNIDGEYCNGTHAATILVSHPGCIEDAVVVSQDLADAMMSYGYKTVTMSFGAQDYPLFPYGTEENPRIHPAIGDRVRADGILMAKRSWDPLLAGVETSVKALRDICGHFDDVVFVDPDAEVVDVRTYKDDIQRGVMKTSEKIQEMCKGDVESLATFYERIRSYYASIRRELKSKTNAATLSPAAHVLIRTAIAHKPDEYTSDAMAKKKIFGYEQMDDYRIEVTVKFKIPFDVASKMTDLFGGKGVTGEVRPTEEMPIDEYGNRVHLIMSGNAMLRRTNYNRKFEHFVNAARRDVQNKIVEMIDRDRYDEAWEYLTNFFKGSSSLWLDAIEVSHQTKKEQYDFLDELRHKPLRMQIPHERPEMMCEIEDWIEKHFPPNRSKLTLTMPDGSKKQTIDDFIVGDLYVIRLDKTGRDASAISAGKFQHFGTISKQHSRDRNRRPVREHPIKFMGESEARHLEAYVGDNITAEIHDRSNNPIVADEVVKSILMTDTPTNIVEAVDRKRFPLGNNRAMAILYHVLECEGCGFTTEMIDG